MQQISSRRDATAHGATLPGIPGPLLLLGRGWRDEHGSGPGGANPATEGPRGGLATVLVFLPGFVTPPSAYTGLLAPLAAHDQAVVAPRLYRPGPAVLRGHWTPADEARRAQAVVIAVRRLHPDAAVWLGGHSRGGQCALLAAGELADRGQGPVGLLLVDPVDGTGREGIGPYATDGPPAWHGPTLIIGAGQGGRCAPAGVNHERFARALPGSRHVVRADLGHADVLTGPWGRLARVVCPGADDPATERAAVCGLMMDAIAARSGGREATLGGGPP